MKLKMLALAVAAAAAAPAFAAVSPAQLTAAVTAGRYIDMTGASATKATVKAALKAACSDAQVAFTADKDRNAYGCTMKASAAGYPAAWKGQPFVVFHSVSGGSLTSILGMSTNAAQQNTTVRTDFAGCASTDGGLTYTGCAVEARRSNGGLSDVEKALFQDVLDTDPPVGVNLAQIVSKPALAAQSFGIAASLPLWYALQAAQGLNTGACVAGNFAPECTPSISRTEYATLVAKSNNVALGDYYGWEVLDLGAYDTSIHAGAGSTEDMIICRRPVTSGTQASSNAHFLGKNCSVAGSEPAADSDDSGRYEVIENAGTSDVKNCLADGSTAGAGRQFRIGVVSSENLPAAGDKWQWLKLDGAPMNADAAQRASAVEMEYGFVMEMVMHYSTDNSITSPDQRTAFDALVAELGNDSAPKAGIFVVPHGTTFYTGPGSVIGRATNGGNNCRAMNEYL
ncbi:MAG: hypothetical protein DWQ11_09865 [Proteobacteria bacterium]|nr:MAG: hypothetical protein DWQ11_09865 [Pseudomonadota bacterium]